MSHRLLIERRLVSIVLSFSLALPVGLPIAAGADEADDFIAQTHRMADGIATNTLNMQLLSALQTAMGAAAHLDAKAAGELIAAQSAKLKDANVRANRAFATASEVESGLTGAQLTRLYQDYLNALTDIATRRLTLDGLRRESYANRAMVRELALGFVKNLDGMCVQGYHVNPYDQIRPSLQKLMTPYEIKLAMQFNGGGGGPTFAPEGSGITLGATDQERAVWALVYAANVVLASYVVTGSVVLTGAAFSGLALGTQLAVLGAGLGFTAAIAAVIIAVEISSARSAATEAVRKQRRMFNNRADHETVNRLFVAKCQAAQVGFANLEKDLDGLANQDPTTLRDFEAARADQQAKLKNLSTVMQNYVDKQSSLLGHDFMVLNEQERSKRQQALADSPEAKAFVKLSAKLTAADLASLVKFVLLDLYKSGNDYAQSLENTFTVAAKLVGNEKDRSRANLLRELAANQNLFEIQLRTRDDLKQALKDDPALAEIYADLDAVILDFAEALFVDGDRPGAARDRLAPRMFSLRDRVDQALASRPDDDLLQHIAKQLRTMEGVTP